MLAARECCRSDRIDELAELRPDAADGIDKQVIAISQADMDYGREARTIGDLLAMGGFLAEQTGIDGTLHDGTWHLRLNPRHGPGQGGPELARVRAPRQPEK
jgi:hypothetical protein